MLILLTPSKTMDFVTPLPINVTTTLPLFIGQTEQLRSAILQYSQPEISELMKVSSELAANVVAMYHDNMTQKAALWTYAGDVFKGFQAATLSTEAANFAQQHLLIPSALYGLVRPFDVIRPYRLEMKTKLITLESTDLYQFWDNGLADYVANHQELDGQLCVLASAEYARVVTKYLPDTVTQITPIFMDTKLDGTVAQIPIYSKMMRGVMARWIVDNRINTHQRLKEFSAHGYWYDSQRSRPDAPVFLRHRMIPLAL